MLKTLKISQKSGNQARKISLCLEAFLGISELKPYHEFAGKVEGFRKYVCVIENTGT